MEPNDEMKALSADEALHDDLHGALCALALGELHGDEARALEARIASEPVLRAQYDEVRATITLVRTSLVNPEVLPAAHMERVLNGARAHAEPLAPIHDLAWYRRPAVLLAASLVLCAGAGFIGLRLMQSETTDVGPGDVTELGRRDVPADPGTAGPARRELERAQEKRSDRGYATEMSSPATTPLGAGEARAEAGDGGEMLALLREDLARVEAPLTEKASDLGITLFTRGVSDGAQTVEEATRALDELASRGLELGAVAPGSIEAARQPSAGVSFDSNRGSAGERAGRNESYLGEPQYVARLGGSSGGRMEDPQGFGGPDDERKALGGFAPPPPLGPATPSPDATVAPGASTSASAAAESSGYAVTELAKTPSTDLDLAYKQRAGTETAPEPTAAEPHVDMPELKVAQDDLTLRLREYRDDDQGGNPRLSGEQLARIVEQEWQRVHAECQRYPNERPRDMYFRFWGDNAFVRTGEDAQSTFGADVDTASYALARRYLREGRAPERAQIRTEEFVNAFTPDLVPPTEDTFGLSVELAPTPFGEDTNHWLVRVGVRGKEVAKSERQPLNLTFVIDTSGSMREQNRLELVKHALRLLVTQLDARDTIAIVAYANDARQILGPTSAAHRDLIESALHPLSPNGSTNAEAGLRMGYALAETTLASGAHSRVVFLSDGVANMGQTDQDRINNDVKRFRDAGIYLNTIGVGMNNHNDAFLEQLANKGDGICDYVDDGAAAEKAIVERFTGAFVPIASDVKLQVEFDPAQVLRWRQLGYENRAIADQDFRNDKIDAGEVGAGHQVTCLYEVELAAGLAQQDPAKALATLRVRWKAPKAARQDPNEIDVFERETTLSYGAAAGSFRGASPGFRRSALAAQFAECLRRSSHARMDDYAALVGEVGVLIGGSPRMAATSATAAASAFTEELAELADLVRRADGLGFGQRPPVTDLERTLDEYRRYQYLRATLQELRSEGDPLLFQFEDMNRTLEQQIRDVLRRDLEQRRG